MVERDAERRSASKFTEQQKHHLVNLMERKFKLEEERYRLEEKLRVIGDQMKQIDRDLWRLKSDAF